MAIPEHLAPLLASLQDLHRWLTTVGVPSTVIGGVASSILGRPRATHDLDALVIVDEDAWHDFFESGIRFGFETRIKDALGFALESRVLLLRHMRTGIPVDVTLAGLPLEEEIVKRASVHEVSDIHIRLPTVEDLIIMKAIASRPRDISDIEGLIDANTTLDADRIRFWVGEFASALGRSELTKEIDRLLDC